MNRRKFLLRTGLGLTAVASLGYYWPNRWKYIVIHHSAGDYGEKYQYNVIPCLTRDP